MISFELGEDLEAIRDTVRRFAAEEIRPVMRQCEEDGALPPRLIKSYLELGLTGLMLSEAQGGLGLGMRAAVVVQEELAWGDIGVANALPGLEAVWCAVQSLGTAEQQALLDADLMQQRGCVALLEPPPGFQLSDTWTFAEEDGDSFVLHGIKAFALNAGLADWTVALAQSQPGTGIEGLRAFLIPPGTAGIAGGERHHLLGLNTAHFGALELSDCRVPLSHMMDGRGDVRGGLHQLLDRLRLFAAARMIGASRAAAEHAYRYSTQREAFGKPLHEHQGLAFMIADMATRLDIARWQVWRAAWAIDEGSPDARRHVAMAFQQTAELSERITTDAVQILGGHGYIQDHPVEKWMRDVRVQAIIGGLEGFLTHDVADAELGLEPSAPAATGGVQ